MTPLALGIESTCDETAAAVVRNGREILSNVIASQAELHSSFGGVVPELASRGHVDRIDWVMREALERAQVSKEDLNLICVARGPGLIGALLVGLNAAKGLALGLGLPLIGVNHVEAHLYAALMELDEEARFPALGIVLSGGHTALVSIESIGSYRLIGSTVDDAIGEAFDKVAALMSFPYPGGPKIEQLALKGDASRYPLRPGEVKRSPFDFSFSGLKTNVLYTLKGQGGHRNAPLLLPDAELAHVAASFQETALGDVITKARRAVEAHSYQMILLGGGVCNNRRLRALFADADLGIPVHWPSPALTLDNAAMIAGLGSRLYQGVSDPLDLAASPRLTSFL
jgi:N6-L-threonylcarbamoyladenine synthase